MDFYYYYYYNKKLDKKMKNLMDKKFKNFVVTFSFTKVDFYVTNQIKMNELIFD